MKNHESLLQTIDKSRIPKHIAIIMDGNGRWAEKQSKKRIFGHQNAIEAVRQTVEGATEIGIKYLTLYAFSSENWNRPIDEVNALMELLVKAINNEKKLLLDNKVHLNAIGNTDKLDKNVLSNLQSAISETKVDDPNLELYLALSYSGRNEIVDAIKNITNDVVNGKIKPNDISENLVSNYLYAPNVPFPELMIRTSGEIRTSNFLIWQSAYTELYFTNTLWPDFNKKDLLEAIYNYQQRERRFGKTSEQILTEKK